MTQPLYVVAGQSNAVRLTNNESVEEALAARDSDAAVVHVVEGGTSIAPKDGKNDWYPFEDGDDSTGELFEELITTISDALASGEYHLEGIIWLQGGADSREDDGPLYGERLTGLYDGLVAEFGSDFQFTIVTGASVTPGYLTALETGDFSDPRFIYGFDVTTGRHELATSNENINILDPLEVWIDAELYEVEEDGTLNFGSLFDDDVHYSNIASDAIGEAFIAQFDPIDDDITQYGAGNDYVVGSASGDTVHLGGGNDTIWAGAGDTGNDMLDGGDDNDLLAGGAGDDTLIGGMHSDTLFGGSGNDALYAGNAFSGIGVIGDTDVIWAGDGNDRVYGDNVDDLLGGGNGSDQIRGNWGDDILYAGADDSSDTLDGGAGNDTLFGGAGDDHLVGSLGDDLIFNGAGDDFVMGGTIDPNQEGSDTLWGGAGDDTLVGGVGADVFAFAPDNGHDLITDFDNADDTLDLTAFGFTAISEIQDIASDSDTGLVLTIDSTMSITFAGLTTSEINTLDIVI